MASHLRCSAPRNSRRTQDSVWSDLSMNNLHNSAPSKGALLTFTPLNDPCERDGLS
jgi:hypothetical protein